MHYCRNADWFEVIRITGPSHNLLGIRLAQADDPSMPVVERLVDQTRRRVDLEDALRNEVIEGVTEANVQLQTTYRVAGIRYVPGDTPMKGVYRLLAKSLIKHIARGGHFTPRA